MIFEVKNISYTYPGMKKKTLDGCSLTLEKGEILSILGPNGAGKSTLLHCLCGLLRPQEGEIFLEGEDIRGMSVKQMARQVGYVQQSHHPVFGYTVLHFVMMGCAPRLGMFQRPSQSEEKQARKALDSLGIGHLAEKPYTDISGGERQQATIARALVQDPQAVLFDEPTAHLDFGKQLLILKRIREMAGRGYAAVMTTHNPDHVLLLGGMVAILDKTGKLETGTVEELLTEERLTDLYQTRLQLRYAEEFSREVCAASEL